MTNTRAIQVFEVSLKAALLHEGRLLLLQEATKQLERLPTLVGGRFFREPLEGRIYGLAVWSPHSLALPYALSLPVSQVPGRVPRRVAQILQLDGVTFANVHLSHGQILNRSQLVAPCRKCSRRTSGRYWRL